MKRLLLILFVFLVASSVCFADGFDVGLSGGISGFSLFGFGLHAAGSTYFGNSIFGLGFFGNAMLYTGSANIMSFTGLFGPVFRLINGETFSMPLAVGLYGGGGYSLDDTGRSGFGLGIGLNVTPQIRLGNRVHLFFRLETSLDALESFALDFVFSTGIGFSKTMERAPKTQTTALPPASTQTQTVSLPPAAAPAPAASTPVPPPLPQTSKYIVHINGVNYGPYEMAQLRQIVQQGSLTKDTLVWKEGMAEWATAGTVSELASLFSASGTPPPLPPRTN